MKDRKAEQYSGSESAYDLDTTGIRSDITNEHAEMRRWQIWHGTTEPLPWCRVAIVWQNDWGKSSIW